MTNKQMIGGALKTKTGGIIPVSKAMRAGDYIFVSGQMAFDQDGQVIGADITEQTNRTLENIRTILRHADADLSDIVKCTCWISNENDFSAFNQAYTRFFSDFPPARSCIPSTLLFGAKVEIEAIAFKPSQS